VAGPGWLEVVGRVWPSSAAAPGIRGEDRPQVPVTEAEHAAGDLGSCGERGPPHAGVRAGASGRDFHRLNAGTSQDGAEGELPSPVKTGNRKPRRGH